MHMDRNIFDLNVSTEAISLYILICSLLDDGLHPALGDVRSRWNGDEHALMQAADELARRRVLESPLPDSEEDAFQIKPRDAWNRDS